MNNGIGNHTGIALLFGALLMTAGCGELDEAPESPELDTARQALTQTKASESKMQDIAETIRQRLESQDFKVEQVNAPPTSDSPVWYAKVSVIGEGGQLTLLATDREGRILEDKDIFEMKERARLARLKRQGTLDDLSHDMLQNELLDADSVELVLYPKLTLPNEPSPPEQGFDKDTKRGDDFAAVVGKAKEDARDALIETLSSKTKITGTLGRGVLVRVEREQVPALVRLDSIASASLAPEYLPQDEDMDTREHKMDQDENMNWAPMRQPGARYDGDFNGTSVKVGVRDNGGPNARAKFGHALTRRTFFGQARCCDVNKTETVDGKTVWTDCEDSGGGICFEDQQGAWNECSGGKSGVCGGSHGNGVVSFLADRGARDVGAPSSHIYYYGDSRTEADGFEWFARNGVHIVNKSNGNTNPNTVCTPANPFNYDSWVRDDNIALFKSAGNKGPTACSDCPSQNAICVGCSSRGVDTMAALTNTRNYPDADIELPNLVVPGSATSWCSPRTAAVAASLQDLSKGSSVNRYSSLYRYPEATKAILMAGAQKNVDGRAVSTWDNTDDGQDGAGGVDVGAVKEIYEGRRWTIRSIPLSGPAQTQLKSVYLNKGERLRAFLTWSKCPTNDALSAPHVDFGLYVGRGTGLFFNQESHMQTTESVSFTAQQAGNYTINLYKWGGATNCNGQTRDIVAMAYDVVSPSCQDRCGGFDPNSSCQCDPACAMMGDCCEDLADQCVLRESPTNVHGWRAATSQGAQDGPGNWGLRNSFQIGSNTMGVQALIQSSNVHTPGQLELGTIAVHSADMETSDYEARLEYGTDDDDGVGVVARFQDMNNYYVCAVREQTNEVKLSRVKDGQVTVLDRDTFFYGAHVALTSTQTLALRVEGNTLECLHDGRVVAAATDADPIRTPGRIGALSWASQDLYVYKVTGRRLQ